jgi:NADH-ubiquinone oxidoreductase chain 5
MYLTIILFPLLSAIASGFVGRKLGVKGSQVLSCSIMASTAILASVAFYEVGFSGSPLSIIISNWIDSESIQLSWSFQLDSLTVSMLLPVIFVSLFVHIYSIGYMEGDAHVQRFFSYLSLFTFFMLILVTGDNFLIVFVGWEGVGICSYLLINYWFRRLQANKAAIQAIIMNRVGDLGFSIGLFAMFLAFGNIDFYSVFSLAPMIHSNLITLVCLLFLLAAMAKSAQIGLHTWLPNAMEGPTPVSALIHAATMVTAGVYLLLRASPLVEQSSTALLFVTWIGALTAFMAATIGLLQNDLKRVIAYSTCSQLGYMVIGCGLSHYSISLFHLVNHAFFKALLFLSAGAIIHALNDEQRLDKMGGLVRLLPFTYSMSVPCEAIDSIRGTHFFSVNSSL